MCMWEWGGEGLLLPFLECYMETKGTVSPSSRSLLHRVVSKATPFSLLFMDAIPPIAIHNLGRTTDNTMKAYGKTNHYLRHNKRTEVSHSSVCKEELKVPQFSVVLICMKNAKNGKNNQIPLFYNEKQITK